MVGTESDAPESVWAQAVAKILNENGYHSEGVLLAAPSSWCLCANIPIADLPRRNRRPLMVYRLEEHLPVAAENLVTDFSIGSALAMGVAADSKALAALIDSLEAEGIWVQSVSPVPLLAAQDEMATGTLTSSDALILDDDGTLELLSLKNSVILNWTTETVAESILQQLRHRALTDPTPVVVITQSQNLSLLQSLSALPEITLVTRQSAATNMPPIRHKGSGINPGRQNATDHRTAA